MTSGDSFIHPCMETKVLRNFFLAMMIFKNHTAGYLMISEVYLLSVCDHLHKNRSNHRVYY